jgi:ribosomal protein L37AE/L43A
MKYNCKKCDFKWEGTSYTFDKVREHEKIHSDDIKLKTARVKIK